MSKIPYSTVVKRQKKSESEGKKMDSKKSNTKPSFFDGALRVIRMEADRRRNERGALLCDILVFAIALFFARKHIAFGAYPLAASLVAVLKTRVWIALVGAVVGAISLGKSGVIHAIILVIIVFLRLIISGSSKEDDGEPIPIFREPLIMRIAAATIGSFVGAAYELLLEGFSLGVVLFGVFGVLLTVAFAVLYSGIFSINVSVSDFLYGTKNIFRQGLSQKDKYNLVLFQGSFLVFSFLICFSLDGYDFFGISPTYLFSTFLTLFVAKRFGAVRAMAVGFVCVLGVSSVQAVSYALCGIAAGLLFKIGVGYAIIGGGTLLCAWSSYAGGMNGFLSVFPEYAMTSLLITPILKNTPIEPTEQKSINNEKVAAEMVGAMAAAYRDKLSFSDSLEESLSMASLAIKRYGDGEGRGEFLEYRKIVKDTCDSLSVTPCEENIDKIATKLYKKIKLTDDDARALSLPVADVLSVMERASAEYEQSCNEKRKMDALAKEYELISKMINEARLSVGRERSTDTALSDKASEVFCRFGFPDGVIKVFGDRKKRVIGAGVDFDGTRITDSELKRSLEEAMGVYLGNSEYFRKNETALFECSAVPMWQVDHATVSSAAGGEVCGDTAVFFGSDDCFYALLSDGMGSGEVAKKTSLFVSEFLSHTLTPYTSEATALSLLNHIIRHKGDECSATVDLFSFDLLSSEAVFIKSGAAPSYIKRDGSLFRIRSQTAPIGLMKSVDSERIKLEIKDGDVIVMLSDGVSATPEDAPWLLDFLNREPTVELSDYADAILSLAKKNSRTADDLTVSVIRITNVKNAHPS